MDGFVVSDAVSQQVNALNAIVDVGADLVRITCCVRGVRKGVREDRDITATSGTGRCRSTSKTLM